MKIPLLLSALWCSTGAASAQDVAPTPLAGRHIASVGAFGLAPNIGLQYEFRLARHWSFGVQGARYFSRDYPGYQAALIGRYYFRPLAPAGLYLQVSAGTYRHDAQGESNMPGYHSTYAKVLSGSGPGLGLGYQWLLKQHLALQATLGLKFYLHDIGVKCDCGYVGDWYAAGQPGSLLDGQFGVGYAF